MKKILLLLSFAFCWKVVHAQNLVPNSGFEQYNNCPMSVANFADCFAWTNFGATPDYYNTCGSAFSAPPKVYGGYQYPHFGDAYAGILAYHKDTVTYREFIGVNLSTPLLVGNMYYLSFYITNGGSDQGRLGCNKMGLKFSTVAYADTAPPAMTNTAHLFTTAIIKDTVNWIQIKGSFIADSAYQFVMIGNFFDSAHVNTSSFGSNADFAYYLIEDVCVSADSVTCYAPVGINEITGNDFQFSVSPNPTDGNIKIIYQLPQNKSGTFEVFDIMGRLIYKMLLPQGSTLQHVQLPALSDGVYNVMINSGSVRVVKKIVVLN